MFEIPHKNYPVNFEVSLRVSRFTSVQLRNPYTCGNRILIWGDNNKLTVSMVKTIASFGLYFLRFKPQKNPTPTDTLISIRDNEEEPRNYPHLWNTGF
jgi:hypothetical protein